MCDQISSLNHFQPCGTLHLECLQSKISPVIHCKWEPRINVIKLQIKVLLSRRLTMYTSGMSSRALHQQNELIWQSMVGKWKKLQITNYNLYLLIKYKSWDLNIMKRQWLKFSRRFSLGFQNLCQLFCRKKKQISKKVGKRASWHHQSHKMFDLFLRIYFSYSKFKIKFEHIILAVCGSS